MNTLIRGDYYGRGGKELDVNVSRPGPAVPAATAAAGAATPSPVPAPVTAAGGAMHSLSLSASEQAAQSRLMNNNSQNVAELLRSVDQQTAGLEKSGGGGARRVKQKRSGRANAVARNVLLQGLRASHLTPTQKEDYLRMYAQGFRPNTMQCGSCGDARGGVPKGTLGAAARQGGVLRRMKRAELRADTAQRHRKLDAEYWSQLDLLNRKRGLNCKTQDSVYSKLDGVFAPVALAMSDHAHHVHLHDSLVRREAADAAAAAQRASSVPAPGAQPKAATKAAAAEPLAAAVAAVPAAAAEPAATNENPNAELCDISMDFDMGTPPGSPPHAASQQAGVGGCGGLLRALDATANGVKKAAVTSAPPQRGRLRKHLAGLRQDGKLIGHSTGLTHEQVAVSLGNAPSVQGAAAASAEAAAAEASLASLAASNAAVVGGAKVAQTGGTRRARSTTGLLAGFVGDGGSTGGGGSGGAGKKAKEVAAEFYRRLYAPQGSGGGGVGSAARSAASCANTITTAKSSSLSLAGGQKIHFVDHSKNRGAWRNPYVIADQRVPVVPVLP